MTVLTKEQVLLFACEIPGQTWYRELSFLYDAVAESKRHVEVGVYCGRSLFVASHGMQSGEIIAIDNRQGMGVVPVDFARDMTNLVIRHANPKVNITLIEASSVDASRRRECQGPFDSAFIDGDHSFEYVLSDIESWLPQMRIGGLMMGHDYWAAHLGVMDAVHKVFGGCCNVVRDSRLWHTKVGVPWTYPWVDEVSG